MTDFAPSSVVFVVEGLLLPELTRKVRAYPKRKLRSFMESTPLDTRMAAYFWDYEWHSVSTVEHVTLLGERVAEEVETRLARDHVPGVVRWSDPLALRSYIESDHVRIAVIGEGVGTDLGPKVELLSDPDLFEF